MIDSCDKKSIMNFISYVIQKKRNHLGHSHKKKYSLKTCERLLLMLLQDFFASARHHRMQNNFVAEECSTLFALFKIKQYYSSD